MRHQKQTLRRDFSAEGAVKSFPLCGLRGLSRRNRTKGY